MASTEGDRSFAVVAATNNNERKLTLNRRRIKVNKEEVDNCKEMVTGRDGKTKITPPEEYIEELDRRTVLFKCKNKENNQVRNPPLEEVRLTFQRWKDEADFSSRSRSFGTVEFVFKKPEIAQEIARETVERKKWVFFPSCLGRTVRYIRVGAINKVELGIGSDTEISRGLPYTQFGGDRYPIWWEEGYGIEARVLMDRNDSEKIQGEIQLEEGKKT